MVSEICAALHHLFNELERFTFPFGAGKLPCNGIYILFEAGERAHNVDRIALSKIKSPPKWFMACE